MRFISELVMRMVDGVTAPARQMRQSISGVTQAIRESNTAALEASSRSLGRTMRGVTADLVGSTAALVAYGVALMKPISAATEFQSKMTTIGQKADYTRRQSLMLGASIRALAPEVNQYAKDIAEGLDVLAGKGLDPQLGLKLLKPIGQAATAYEAEIKDLSEASYAVYGNLRVPLSDTAKVLDVMAAAGKAGAFELKDMARHFPALAASAQGLKQEGVSAVADLSAALQIAIRGTGNADQAATNVGNLMQKIRAPQTVKAFQKMGVDLVASLNRLEAEGRTPIEAISELTNKTLKGDMSRLGYLFEDAEVQKALRPLIRDLKEYREIRAKAMAGGGTVSKDYAERMKDDAQRQKQAAIAAEQLKTAYGTALLPILGAVAQALTPMLQSLAALVTEHPKLVAAVTAGVGAFLAAQVAISAVSLVSLASKKGLVDMALGWLGAGKGATSAASLVGRAGGAIRGALGGVIGLATRAADGLILGVAGGGLKAFGMLERLRSVSFAGLGRRILALGVPLRAFAGHVAGLPGLAIRAMSSAGAAFLGFFRLLSPSSIVGFGRALLGLLSPVNIVRGAMMALRIAMIGTGVGAIIVGIAMLAAFVIKHWRGFVTFFQGVARGFSAAIAPVRPALQPFIDGIKAIFGWVGSLFKGKPGEDWSQYGVAVGKALGDGVLALVNFARWVGECINKVREFFGLKGKPPAVSLPGAGGQNPQPPKKPGGGWFAPKQPPARARGGPVQAGQDYMVGEEGPEVVRFQRSGRVFPTGVTPPPISPSASPIAPVPAASPSAGRQAPQPAAARPAARANAVGVFNYSPTFNVMGVSNAAELVDLAMRDLRREVQDLWQGGMFDNDMRPA